MQLSLVTLHRVTQQFVTLDAVYVHCPTRYILRFAAAGTAGLRLMSIACLRSNIPLCASMYLEAEYVGVCSDLALVVNPLILERRT